MKIYIKTTEACQLHCQHCYIGGHRSKHRIFDEVMTKNWVKELLKVHHIPESSINFSFHGGEPFIAPIVTMRKFAEAFPSARFDSTTNLCYELTNDFFSFVLGTFRDPEKNNRPFLKTSYDYRIRFTPEQLSLWKRNIDILNHHDIDVRVITCLTSYLVDELEPEQLFDFFYGLGIREVHFERLTPNTTEDKSLIPDYVKQDEWLTKFYQINCGEIFVDNFEELEYACKHEHINCRGRHCMRDVITINADGTIGGCPNSAPYHSFTSIYKDPKDFFKNKVRDELIHVEKLRNPECYVCDLFEICNGDCHQLSWQGNICPAPKHLIRTIAYDVKHR